VCVLLIIDVPMPGGRRVGAGREVLLGWRP
jgi:hypothetical protein